MADWDDTESEEEEAARLEKWLATYRAVWYISHEISGVSPEIGKPEYVERPLFAGLWEIQEDFDPETGQMLMSGLPDFPDAPPVRVEIHRLDEKERPDEYQPEKDLEYAFEHVLVIRPVKEPMKRRKEGKKWIISLDQEQKPTVLRLSGRLGDF